MSYLSSTKQRRRTREVKPFVFLVVVIFIFGGLLFSPLKKVFETLAYKTQGTKAVYSILNWFSSKKQLLKDREELYTANALNEVLQDEIEILKEENDVLRGQGKNSADQITAQVLLHPGFSPYDVFVLNVGEMDGVKLGDFVFYQSLLLGEISEVNGKTSKARLFSSGDKTFPVRVGVHDAELEARGLGSGTFEIIVPKNLEVQLGDKVKMTTPLKYLGVVLDIESEESNAFQRVLFSLPININHVRFVTIESHE
jgi:cell shape-determining protein MreC